MIIKKVSANECMPWGYGPVTRNYRDNSVYSAPFLLHIVFYLIYEIYYIVFRLPMMTSIKSHNEMAGTWKK